MTELIALADADSLSQSGRASSVSSVSYAGVLCVYGAGHFVVDACCATVVFSAFATGRLPWEELAGVLLLYHALAFGLQPIFGLVADWAGTPRLTAVLGGLISCAAVLLRGSPMPAIVVASLGNAVFHVGGGAVSLRLTPHRATAPGLFVAPGSVGLLVGVMLGGLGEPAATALVVLSLAVSLAMAWVQIPESQGVTAEGRVHRAELVVGLLLLVIVIRSLFGTVVTFDGSRQPVEFVLLAGAVLAGKALGGILADRWGWLRVGVGSLVAATPLVACAASYPPAAIPGLLLLNLSMAIALAAIAEALPGWPGFAFGLTSLAYLVGAMPSLFNQSIDHFGAVALLMLLSSVALYQGLKRLPGGLAAP